MSVFDEPKVDAHCHVLDPARFPYAAGVAYRPAGQEVGTLAQYEQVMLAYGVRHALFVGPNSGYGSDNRCLLDALERGQGRFKGVAVVDDDVPASELARLKAAGVVGVAFNPSLHGVQRYANSGPLLRRLADLDLFVQVQVEGNQLVAMQALLEEGGARIVVDHCGRPLPRAGLEQAGFKALLALGKSRRAVVKLSGFQKFSSEPAPYNDTRKFVQALLDTFTPDACVWASDWPFLKAPQRLDFGPLLKLAEGFLPDASDRRRVMWDSPRRHFGFAEPIP